MCTKLLYHVSLCFQCGAKITIAISDYPICVLIGATTHMTMLFLLEGVCARSSMCPPPSKMSSKNASLVSIFDKHAGLPIINISIVSVILRKVYHMHCSDSSDTIYFVALLMDIISLSSSFALHNRLNANR